MSSNLETSLYMIKPEAMRYQEEIVSRIGQSLEITGQKELVLPDWAITEIYEDLPTGLWRATRYALANTVSLGIVQGEDAVERMHEIAGRHTAPAECDKNSLRFLYGISEPTLIQGVVYYRNAIHRPKDPGEASRHVDLFVRL